MEHKGIFQDLKVIDFATTVVGPSSTRVLADYGARVVKVESITHPDVLRTSHPFKDGKPGVSRSGYFSTYNAGKYSLSLNMNKPKALELTKRLAKWADVLVESFRPGVMKKWGLDYGELKKINPALIMVSTNMLGQDGPFCQFRGYGQHGGAIAGWGLTLGWPDRPALIPFGAYTDLISARFVAIAVMAALEYRRHTGKGQYIDNSQVECSIDYMAPLILDSAANQSVFKCRGNRDPYAAPHGAYRCLGEDRWCALAVATDQEWDAFREVLGSLPWTQDPRFATFVGRKKHEDELDRYVEEWTQKHTAEEVAERMQARGISAGVVENAEDLTKDPQLAHRGHFQVRNQREMGLHSYETFAFRLSKTSGGPQTGAPSLGEHNEYICTEILGLSDEEFVQLLDEGVLE